MVARNDERKLSNASNHKHIDGVGYVPRDRQESIKDTGLTSAGMLSDHETEHEVSIVTSPTGEPNHELCSYILVFQKLDDASAAGLARLQDKDAKIDQGIDRLDHTIDNIAAISSAMKHEVAHQNEKIGHLAGDVQKSSEKHRDVNARQRHILNSN